MFPSPLPPRRTSTRSVPRFAPAILLTSFVAAIVLASGGWAWATSRMPPTAVILSGGDTTVVWGPDTMRTLNGHHQTFVEAIGITAQAGKQYAVRLTRIGSGNLNEATVTFNHRTIASKSDFVGTGTTITLPVKLTGADTITVDVKGDNGVGLVVAFVSATDATVVVFAQTFTTSDNNGNDSNSNSDSGSASDTTVQFLRPTTVGQPAYLYVNAVRPTGFNPASADIYLNGVRIIDHGDGGFAREVTSLAVPVTLVAGTNTLRVVERGKSPTRFSLEIRATTTVRPVLTITSPAPNAFTKNTSIVVTGTVTDATTVTVTVNGVTAALGAGHSFSATIPLLNEGSNPITVHAVNAAGLATDSARTVTRDTHPPVLIVIAPTDQLLTNSDSVTVSGSVSDATAVRLTVQGVPLTGGSGGAFSARVALAEGANFIIVLATDAAGNTTSIIRQVNRDKTPPVLAVTSPANGATTTDATIPVSGIVQDANTVTLTVNGNPVTVGQGGVFTTTVSLQTGANTITVVATDAATNQATVIRSVTRTTNTGPTPMTETLPADLTVNAPALIATASTPTALATAFLYAGPNPIQVGVLPGAIDSVRAGALRGRVRNVNGQSLSGVNVSIAGHPELGHTISRATGLWDLAVNGGGDVIVRFTGAGVLPVQRKVVLPWQQIIAMADVIMTPPSTVVTAIGFTQPIEVARGPIESDANGARQATLLFRQGTQATLVRPDGSTQLLATLHVRATEFTVGEKGLRAMPAELPPTTAYTYAVDLNADEAMQSGGTLRFSQPVPVYVNNFLGFRVGSEVPVGSYDAPSGRWVPERNGRVIRILAIAGGVATIDATGDSTTASAATLDSLGIDAAEQRTLATLYPVGTTLWRWQAEHFTAYDANYGQVVPPGTRALSPFGPSREASQNQCTECSGSIVSLENQSLGERLGIQGAPFVLSYSTEHTVAGQRHANSIRIPVTGPIVDNIVQTILVSIDVAGRSFSQTVPVRPNQTIAFEWDGLDAYGRTVQSAQATVTRTVFGSAAYVSAPAGRAFGGGCAAAADGGTCSRAGVPTRLPGSASAVQTVTLSRPSVAAAGLGGWSVSVHHAFDPDSRTLTLGDGHVTAAARAIAPSAVRFAGTTTAGNTGDGGPALNASFQAIGGIAVAPDGALYVADSGAHVVRRIGRDGIVTRVAGTAIAGNGAPGASATTTALDTPGGIAVGANGDVYIADNGNARVLRLANGTLTLVAGGNGVGADGDGGPATAARFIGPLQLALTRNTTLLVLDVGNGIVREVSADGTIRRFAGGGQDRFTCGSDGIAATAACLDSPSGLAILGDGSVALATGRTLRKVDGAGIIRTLAGLDTTNLLLASCRTHDADNGVRALTAGVCPRSIAVMPDGSMYLSEMPEVMILRRITPEGKIVQVRLCPDALGLVNSEDLPGSCRHVAAGPDGALYFTADSTIDRLDRQFPGFGNAAFRVASEDGGELYEFSDVGRHLRTLDALTGVTLLTFQYDGAGHLVSVTDAYANVTTIERNASGAPTGIVSPYGERTTLATDANGRLAAVTNPASETVALSYDAGGLLTALTDPRHNVTRFTYDSLGRLTKDENAVGGFSALTRAVSDVSDTVTMSDALNRVRRVTASRLDNGTNARSAIDAAGLRTTSDARADGTTTTREPDQTLVTQISTPDPRYGAQVHQVTQSTLQLPSGLTSTVLSGRSIHLNNPTDPSSLAIQTDSVVLAGQTVRSVYTAASQTLLTTSPEGRTSALTLDLKSRVTQVATPGLAPINYSYDLRGRLASASHGDRSETYTYNAQGRLATIVDPVGRISSFNYDAAGRETNASLPGGRMIAFTYDSVGNITSLTPPGRPAHAFTYNAANLPTLYQAPTVSGSTGITSYSYSKQQELIALIRPDSQTVSITYDAAGRPNALSSDEGQHGINYSATTGQVTSISAPHGVVQQIRYDGALQTGTTWIGPVVGAVDFTYDSALRLRGIFVNGNGISGPSYDRDGMPITNGTLSFRYGGDNGLLQTLTGTSHTGAWAYDSLAQVKIYAVTYDITGDTAYRAAYTYDKLGRITRVAERVQSDTATYDYGYDAAGRLATVQHGGVTIAAYSYDPNGNRTQTVYTSQSVAGTYDNQDRLLSYGTATYAYSGSGDLKLKTSGPDSTKYRYDAFGNLREAFLPNGDHVEYVIDAQQRRIGRMLNGALQKGWLYQSQLTIAAEVDAMGAVVKEFTYGTHVNVPDRMRANGIVYRIVTDHLGSVRLVIAPDGTVAQRIDYDVYGRILLNTYPGFQPFGYAGGLLDDATGLTRFGARDYDAEVGRWTAAEPLGLRGNGMNQHDYAGGDPVNYVDPNGLVVIFVHGTALFGNADPYGTFSATFQVEVQRSLGESHAEFLQWSGGLQFSARLIAARELAQQISRARRDHPGESITIVTHSHGANVALLAAECFGSRIDLLITLGAPLLAHVSPGIGRWYNVYSPRDPVVGMETTRVQARRSDPSAFNIQVDNPDLRGIDLHSWLHSVDAWRQAFKLPNY